MRVLELSEDEFSSLKVALDVYLVQMRGELVHTDDRQYRSRLRKDLEQLEGIRHRMDSSEGKIKLGLAAS